MKVSADQNIKEASISITVTRADGTVEEYGEVSYYHKNPLRRWAWRLRHMRRKYGNQGS